MKIIVEIFGGLGNQLFQYAAGFGLAKLLGCPLQYCYRNFPNRPFFLNGFSIQSSLALEKDFSEIKQSSHFLEKTLLAFDRWLLKRNISFRGKTLFQHKPAYYPLESFLNETSRGSFFLRGYWQSEKYFLNCKEEIKLVFALKEREIFEKHHLFQEITQNNSTCIHVRRGDYLNKKNIKLHGIVKEHYYSKAIEYVQSIQSNPVFYCFSDDIKLAKEVLKEIRTKINYVERSENPLCDFGLMQQCKHFIIANSTFSWWAAWLSKNTQKNVIAPKAWFVKTENPDIYPTDWIIL